MIYERIKALCKLKGITVNQLEKMAGIASSSCSKIDKHAPSQDKIERIANVLDSTPEYIMYGTDERFSDKNAKLVSILRRNPKLSDAIDKWMELDEKKQDHVIELINLLSE